MTSCFGGLIYQNFRERGCIFFKGEMTEQYTGSSIYNAKIQGIRKSKIQILSWVCFQVLWNYVFCYNVTVIRFEWTFGLWTCWLWHHVILYVVTNISEEHITAILRVKVKIGVIGFFEVFVTTYNKSTWC
jgi:hypothetical protein